MTLRLKKNHKITFTAPDIRFIDTGFIAWWKIECRELDGTINALPADMWEEVKEEKKYTNNK